MTDAEITTRLETIVAELEQLRRERWEFARPLQDAKRIAAIAIASRNTKLLKNQQVIDALSTIPKPTVAEKEYLVEMEIGEFAFKDAVIDAKRKMLEGELEAVKNLMIHVASIRKGERV